MATSLLKIIQRRTAKYIIWVKRFLLLILAILLIWLLVFLGKIGLYFGFKAFKGPLFVFSVLFQRRQINLKNTNGTTHVLLLGIRGEGDDSPNLTDTMILVSINPKKKFVIFTSIPRDVYLPSLQTKINAAYAIGEARKKGAGITLAKDAIAEILDVTPHYVVRVNFLGFEKAVDLLGGVQVYVDQSFVDNRYPLAGHEDDTCGIDVSTFSGGLSDDMFPCRFETLSFPQGLVYMNGQTALKYSRSRHAPSAEGTDFARSQRQQKVILALKNKFFSTQTLLSAKKITALLDLYKNYIVTDIKEDEYDDFIKLAFASKNSQYDTFYLDQGNESEGREGFLISPPVSKYGAWVLEPKTGTWEEVQKMFKKTIEAD